MEGDCETSFFLIWPKIRRLDVPKIEKKYEILIPIDKDIYSVTKLIEKSIFEFTNGSYLNVFGNGNLINKKDGKIYDVNLIIKETDIRNGTELILI